MQLGSAFAHHFDIFLLRDNYVINLLNRIKFFDDVRITLHFDMFELRMEITLQSCFVFARCCDVFLLRYNYVNYLFDVVTFELRLEITLQLRYVFARHSGVILLRHNDVVLLSHNCIIYLSGVVTFFGELELCYILLRLNYVWK